MIAALDEVSAARLFASAELASVHPEIHDFCLEAVSRQSVISQYFVYTALLLKADG
jgi:hypothetical protein